jgi:hypothetical protein
LHGGKKEESGVPVESVDEIGKAGQGDTIILAVEILQSSVDLEDVCEGAGSLYA